MWGPRSTSSGQAVVEFALILPLMLLLLLGVFAVGVFEIRSLRLVHAAIEGAVAGAGSPGDPCGLALETARKVYGSAPDTSACDVQGQFIEVTLSDRINLPPPLDWLATSSQRAALR